MTGVLWFKMTENNSKNHTQGEFGLRVRGQKKRLEGILS